MLLLLAACAGSPAVDSAGDTGAPPDATGPFAAEVVSFTPGEGAGYGQDRLPDIVLGPPRGAGDQAGSTDVLSLGRGGEIVLSFGALSIVDGPGDDLVVFENPFSTWIETGFVAVSDDGEAWHEWPCDPTDPPWDGCAGVAPVHAHPGDGIDPTSPEAGGDRFDLADLGLSRARYVRIRDSGHNAYAGLTGGFDLDAVAVINGE